MEVKYCPTCTVNFLSKDILYLNDAGLKDFDKAMQESVKKEDNSKSNERNSNR